MSNSKETMQEGRLLCKSRIDIEKMNTMDKVLESQIFSQLIKTLSILTNMGKSSCLQIRAQAR